MAKKTLFLPGGHRTSLTLEEGQHKKIVEATLAVYYDLTETARQRRTSIACSMAVHPWHFPDGFISDGKAMVKIAEIEGDQAESRIFLIDLDANVVEWIGGVR